MPNKSPHETDEALPDAASGAENTVEEVTASPTALGYRLPAEWEPHAATWLTWPHYEGTWPGKLEAIAPVYVQIAQTLARSEPVHINVLPEAEPRVGALLQRAGLRVGGALGDDQEHPVVLHPVQTNNEWIRDYGALTVVRRTDGESHRIATKWGFNNWGEKYEGFALNNRMPFYMAATAGLPIWRGGMILEGGSIEVNGEGALLTSESCLLNPNRNPSLSQAEIEERLRRGLGVTEIHWLGDGIAGDDTDGHIDDCTRFVAPNAVVTAVESDRDEVNYRPLQENLERLQRLQVGGQPLTIHTLPMPRPRYHEGERLPASYANFYIANTVVLLPQFGDPADDEAVAVLQTCFPERTIAGIDCTDLVWGFGAFHCLTQQVPAG